MRSHPVDRSPASAIELETVDDRERGTEPDVLRSQVAVTIDNKSSVNPIDEDWRAVFEKSSLNGGNTRNLAVRQVEVTI